MYNNYINNKIKEKIDYDLNLLREYIIISINLLIKFYSNKEIRMKLNKLIADYYKYSKEEYKLLNIIKKMKDNYQIEDEILFCLEEIENKFVNYFNYLEMILGGYEEAIFYDDIMFANFNNREFDVKYMIDKQNKIKILSNNGILTEKS